MPGNAPAFPGSSFIAWLLLLCWAPLPRASNPPWAQSLLILLTLLLALLVAAQACWLRLPLVSRLKPHALPLGLLLLVPLWASLQCLSLPVAVLELLSPNTAALYRDAGLERGSLSLDAGRSQVQALWSWALWLYFALALLLLDTPERVKRAALCIVYCGVAQALYGSFMTLSGLEYGFFHQKEFYRGVATGTFINRNHLAGYLELCLAVGIGLLVATLQQHQHRRWRWRDRMRQLLDTLLGPKMRLRVFLALMVIALVLTRSRMGNTAFFSSLFICGVVLMAMQRRFHKGAIILFASLMLVDFLIVGQWFGFEKLAERLESTSVQTETRDEVVRDTLTLMRDFPLTGTGLGSFAVAFPQYQQADVRGFYDHAHNDYLQFSAELGLPGMLPLALLVLLSLGRALLSMYWRHDSLARGMAFASCMGITALLIHSAVDFNLQIPANAQLFCVVLALAWISARLQHVAREHR